MVTRVGPPPLSVVFTLLLSCAAEPSGSPRAHSPGPVARPQPTFEGAVGAEHVRVQNLALQLPDAAHWRASQSGSWSVLRHVATDSTLYLRQWPAPRLVRPGECREDARLGQPYLLELAPAEVVERRRVGVPPGFDGELTIGVQGRGRSIHGYAELVSAGIARCCVVVFRTVTSGRGREEEVGRRLAIMARTTFEDLLAVPIEDRVRRQ